ncbi:MAG: sugar ABC transporter permease [Ruminococcaceae bacterium]|nr:sugar ABC transporter permease [Oscillospiraceae bacterium]
MEKVKNTTVSGIKERRNTFSANKYMYILLAPAVICVFIFGYAPLCGLLMAFKDYDALVGFAKSPWVGFENIKNIFEFPNFIGAIKNTLLYSSVCLFGQFPFPILLAIMLNEVRGKTFKKVSQTVTYLPHFLSWISVVGFAYSMFALHGPFNNVMVRIFGESYERTNILLESDNFLGFIFFSGLWKEVGWSSIIYLAAIAGIDQALYEAAAIDGAGKLKQIWHITLPSLRTTAVLVLIMNVGSLVTSNFEQVYGFQNVYTQTDTEVINTLVYREGIQNGEYSMATAFGLVQGLVSLMLVMAANKLSKKLSGTAIW